MLLHAQQEKKSTEDYFEYLHSLKFCTLCEVILKLLGIVGGIMRPGIISAINVDTMPFAPPPEVPASYQSSPSNHKER